jgi:hypothetical protein
VCRTISANLMKTELSAANVRGLHETWMIFTNVDDLAEWGSFIAKWLPDAYAALGADSRQTAELRSSLA